MSTLYVDRRNAHLKLDAGAIAFYENGRRSATVPLAPLRRVILRGSITLQAGLLAAFGAQGIGVLFLSGRRGKPTLLLGPPHNDCTRRLVQMRHSLDRDFCLHYARQLGGARLRAQAAWLAELAREHAQCTALNHATRRLDTCARRIAGATRAEELRRISADANDTCLQSLRLVVPPELPFEGRCKDSPGDPFSALLDLTDTIVTAEAAMALHTAGFDSGIGFYHGLTGTDHPLAQDVAEPLRPLAHRLCLDLARNSGLRTDHFSNTASGCLLGKKGRRLYYAAYEAGAGPLRLALAGQVRHLMEQLGLTNTSPQTADDGAPDGTGWPWTAPSAAPAHASEAP